MKYNINYLLITLLIVVVSSCDNNNDVHSYADIGGNAILKETKISIFDTNVDLHIKLQHDSDITVKQVEVYNGDKKATDATIKGDAATFSSSSLGSFLFPDDDDKLTESTGSFDILMLTTLSNEKVVHTNAKLKVAHSIFMDKEVATVKYKDTTKAEVSFNTFVKYATVNKISLWWKKNKGGTYAKDDNHVLDINGDSINIGDLKYIDYGLVVGDTLYYKFIAHSGDLSDNTSTSVAIIAQTMGASVSSALSADDKYYNLMTGEDIDSLSEIEYLSPAGIKVSDNSKTKTVLDFVYLGNGESYNKMYEDGDLLAARDAYNAGTAITEKTPFVKGDMVVYKAVRTYKDDPKSEDAATDHISYGYIKIGDITSKNSDESTTILDFKHEEGSIIEKTE